jgi:predicted nucleic acid-binding protein
MNGKIKMRLVQIYLDTNVFIEMFETRTVASAHLWDLFGKAGSSGFRFITSELTLAEILVKPLETAQTTSQWKPVYDYRMIVSNKPGFQSVIPVSRDILDASANIRALIKGVKLPDAIHLATAIDQECDFFLSNDRKLAKKCTHANPPFSVRHFVNFKTLAGQSFEIDNA